MIVKMLEQRRKEHYARLGQEVPARGNEEGATGASVDEEDQEEEESEVDRVFVARAGK
jgi:hypothetical protein